jgi:hypothetical protein
MNRLRSWGRPTRLIVALIVAGAALAVLGTLVIHGTPSRSELLVPGHPGQGRIQVSQTGARDYLRLALDVAGVALVLAGVLRWSTRQEGAPQESDARHGYGDSIVDIRTSVDPEIGIRASELPRHHWPL